MGARTTISWCDATFNPWRGCAKVSPGCANCYAEKLAERWGNDDLWGPDARRVVASEKMWREPRVWDRAAAVDGRRRRVFCGSMCDVFEDREDLVEPRDRLLRLILATPNLDWLLLTKRPAPLVFWSLTGQRFQFADIAPRVWLGVSVESAAYAWRIDNLRRLKKELGFRVAFVSYEPALGPLDDGPLDGIDWLIYGGESGPGYRPDEDEWWRRTELHCNAMGVAFWMKQRAAQRPGWLPPGTDPLREFPAAALPIDAVDGIGGRQGDGGWEGKETPGRAPSAGRILPFGSADDSE